LQGVSYSNDLIRAHSAFADGRLSGLDLGEQESVCPFPKADPHLRGAWMDGFMIGRVERQIRQGGYNAAPGNSLPADDLVQNSNQRDVGGEHRTAAPAS
jgi:hypothetical protein